MRQQARSSRLHTTVPLPAKIRQIDGLQVLRAVAVTLVAWAHAGIRLGQRLPNFGIFGIDIFFVISGFIMCYIVLNGDAASGVNTSWRFFLRRLVRIYPIYWIFAVIVLARLAHSHAPRLYRYLGSLTLFPDPRLPRVIDFSWTLMFEMFFYFVMAAVLLFTVRRAAWAVIFLLSVGVAVGITKGVSGPLSVIVCNPILAEFAYGAVIALAFYRLRRLPLLGIGLLALGIAASVYFAVCPPHAATSMDMILAGQEIAPRVETWGVAAALLVGGMVFWSPAIKSRVGLFTVILGNSSYSAYLASLLVLEFVSRALFKILPAPGGGPETWALWRVFFYQFGQTAAVLFVGWLSYQFVEWPLVRALQRRLAATRIPADQPYERAVAK